MMTKSVTLAGQKNQLRKVEDIKNEALNLGINNVKAEFESVRDKIRDYGVMHRLKLTGLQDAFTIFEDHFQGFARLARTASSMVPEYKYDDIATVIMTSHEDSQYLYNECWFDNNHRTKRTDEYSMVLAEFHLVRKLTLKNKYDLCIDKFCDIFEKLRGITIENKVARIDHRFFDEIYDRTTCELNNFYCAALFASALDPYVEDAQKFINSIKISLTDTEFKELTTNKAMTYRKPEYEKHKNKNTYA